MTRTYVCHLRSRAELNKHLNQLKILGLTLRALLLFSALSLPHADRFDLIRPRKYCGQSGDLVETVNDIQTMNSVSMQIII